MYCIRDNEIKEIEIIKKSRRGSAAWCKFKGITKLKLVSFNKIFPSKEEALKDLNSKRIIKITKEKQALKAFKEKQKLAFKIMNITNEKIPMFTYLNSSLEDLKKYLSKKLNSNANKNTLD
ncbi:hypothetical protein Z958_05620 [Clostridium novyi B str. NCTC 9691]|nr:hypothetical protein Z958_05620 [Clostridium novyi B str. NCTC 9691]